MSTGEVLLPCIGETNLYPYSYQSLNMFYSSFVKHR